MTFEELERLNPCSSGLDYAKRYNTVEEAFNDCMNISFLLWFICKTVQNGAEQLVDVSKELAGYSLTLVNEFPECRDARISSNACFIEAELAQRFLIKIDDGYPYIARFCRDIENAFIHCADCEICCYPFNADSEILPRSYKIKHDFLAELKEKFHDQIFKKDHTYENHS